MRNSADQTWEPCDVIPPDEIGCTGLSSEEFSQKAILVAPPSARLSTVVSQQRKVLNIEFIHGYSSPRFMFPMCGHGCNLSGYEHRQL
ncbi:hypothetical protein E4U36_001970 [Claviceps purpurea]|nr:hypothetical protein E4U36_001970 [Claviceps purpurea]